MAGKEMTIGALSRAVAANVKRLRTDKLWSVRQLSEQVQRVANWEINPMGIRRIEAELRRVSADDLGALALALNVSPMVLMLPEEDSVIVPAGELYSVADIWDWLIGKQALIGDQLTFLRASNPLDWPRMAALIEKLGVSGDLAAGVLSSRASSALAYEPPAEIAADSDEVRKLLREFEEFRAARRGDS
jgi:hypothetical protein